MRDLASQTLSNTFAICTCNGNLGEWRVHARRARVCANESGDVTGNAGLDWFRHTHLFAVPEILTNVYTRR